MELVFLGTGAGMPSTKRNVTASALQLLEEKEGIWLFDCGEGTQQQILKSSLKMSKLNKLFVTHLHGDHIYGIPGLLTSRGYQGGASPFQVIGPKGIAAFIRNALEISDAHLEYELDIVEIEEETDRPIVETDSFVVTAKRVEHRIESFGYRIREKDRPGTLDAEKLKRIGVTGGPLFGKLKQGQEVVMPDGQVLKGEDFLGPAQPGRVVVIVGDTRYCQSAIELAQGADLLVHEATFAQERAESAQQYFHATTMEAATVAKNAGVRTLVMTHLSQRYQDNVEPLLKEARSVFERSYIAEDFWSIHIPKR
ncbi:ribonuclease Z [Paenibacillus sp. J31TS4]|uniref:ribonuclease Z n=1 Tax=Paenibacillus sp. J31TS4 TaxID=2807195 RepID=UPI001B0FDEB2|nr:ribonuclease Z [Paenibacillus sp. J31TS4]GIP37311.1 ribonuclease Z [Paenibacillus sp. J31TS4]